VINIARKDWSSIQLYLLNVVSLKLLASFFFFLTIKSSKGAVMVELKM